MSLQIPRLAGCRLARVLHIIKQYKTHCPWGLLHMADIGSNGRLPRHQKNPCDELWRFVTNCDSSRDFPMEKTCVHAFHRFRLIDLAAKFSKGFGDHLQRLDRWASDRCAKLYNMLVSILYKYVEIMFKYAEMLIPSVTNCRPSLCQCCRFLLESS